MSSRSSRGRRAGPSGEEVRAEALGRRAFGEGRLAVPALDPGLCEMLAPRAPRPGGTIGAASAVLILDAWVRGWHRANAAAPVPEADGAA